MIKHLKDDMNNYITDINQNIKQEENVQYLNERTIKLFDNIADKMENIMKLHESEIAALVKRQEETEVKIDIMENLLKDIKKDIYDEPDDEFEIICPYCNLEFEADVDEETIEVECPSCGKSIELDWNGNIDDDDEINGGCSGNCNNCSGCEEE